MTAPPTTPDPAPTWRVVARLFLGGLALRLALVPVVILLVEVLR